MDGKRGYATSDLIVPHPTKASLWRVFGRADDQIMLSTGEKVRANLMKLPSLHANAHHHYNRQILDLSVRIIGLLRCIRYSYKTSPLESIILKDSHIAGVAMFGRGKFQNGILIEPKKEFQFDPRDEAKLVEFRNLIW